MTNIEFNQCKLKKRLDFRMIEAARFVLVHGASIDDAVKLYLNGISGGNSKLVEAINLFKDSQEGNNKQPN